ncbi:YecA family protein [Acetobacterium woodii]|uniref:SEC-C motif domain protein n=1 Tax=Acetobacterium woodii (strain ATCC 29683 / DSM 1030 / JCM 2381 / KCTC 1655 / WB1) TaxID=931626 RepID=H6LK02_ACEWD|nr:SEC-C domain-containing protein [Acetobacterium woodii]AFA48756.1 hypothetical protein Awo_c19780 [Acetobacterium woodii DSM 1030]
MSELSKQVQDVLKLYPDLSAKDTNNGYLISGRFILNSEFSEIPLYDEYFIEMNVSLKFPTVIPTVREVSGNIPEDFEHIYENKELCLGVSCDLYDFLACRPSIIDFLNGPVTSFFYTASYFKRYKTVPYGERSHGIEGIIEAYLERYQLSDIMQLITLLAYVAGIYKYRGHILCPCNSGKKFRNCHGQIVLQDLTSSRNERFKKDAIDIIGYYFNKKGER